MKIKHPLRLAILSTCILLLSFLVVINMLKIINEKNYETVEHLKMVTLKAERGNIYTHDYQLLSVTSNRYDLRFDGTYLSATESELNQLAEDLSKIFKNKSKKQYLNDLIRSKKQKYFLLKRDASLVEIEELKKTNFYKKPLNGGLIIKQYLDRQKPNNNLASRTIGDLFKDNNTPIYGLEYSYNAELMGQDGKQLVLYEPGLNRSINSPNNIDPQAGKDLITTIELSYQDILEKALLRQLEKFEADFGTAILMEVGTGQIKALVNLKKTKDHKYAETYNFGVAYPLEPGSTFKLASVMAYLEDFNGSVEDTIDCKNGIYKFPGAPIPTIDSEKLGLVSLKEAFSKSSNIGIGRLITKKYYNNPEKFINRIYNFGLGNQSKIDLEKVPFPTIKSSGSKSWSGISLPWMSYGYGISLTALDILTFYNTVANNGQIVYPHLGYALRQGSKSYPIIRDDMSYQICSELTIKKVHDLLRDVVVNGTGKQLNNLSFPVSGKTGTTVKNYTKDQQKEYQASFVGFFPSNKPNYSCIVVVDNPNIEKGYYGSQIAVPAFREIAHEIYLQEGLSWNVRDSVFLAKYEVSIENLIDIHYDQHLSQNIQEEYYPSVVGMHLTDAIQLLEECGHNIIVKGEYGVVKKQYPKAKTKIKEDLAITLFI
jgi:cell division protein FtsI (penicillin-binding protein 3)